MNHMALRCFALIITVTIGVYGKALGQQIRSLVSKADSLYAENRYDLAVDEYLKVVGASDTLKEHGLGGNAMLSLSRCYYHLYDRQTALKWLYRLQRQIDDQQLDALRSEA